MRKFFCFLGLFLFTFFSSAQLLRAQAPVIVSNAAVVMDAATGTIIYSKNPDMEIPPASLTKLMTMHLALREIYAGRASFDEIIEPTQESWAVNQPPFSSLMRLAPGHRLSLRELLLGLAVFSGNDASAAVALRFAPTVDAFVDVMNREARAMGLTRTRFDDASGYSPESVTTAREFAEFSRLYLYTHPQSLIEFHSVREFAYPRADNLLDSSEEDLTEIPDEFHETRVQRNRNNLLGSVEGVDGLKTGSIPAAGFNISLTAERGATRFIAVILGAPSGWGGDRIRDEDGRRLLEWAFGNFKTIRPLVDVPQPVRVWKGKRNYANLSWGEPLEFTALIDRGEDLDWIIEIDNPIIAPLPAFSPVGSLVFYDNFGELRHISLVTSNELERGSFFKRFFDSIRLFFKR